MAAGGTDKDYKLVIPDLVVECNDGDDVTLHCHLSPETNAVAMEIRWFKGTDCIYLYRNGHVIEGRGYEGRVSVDPQQLQRGDVSLTLRRSRRGDDFGVHTCQVISGGHQEEGRVGLGIYNWDGVFDMKMRPAAFDMMMRRVFDMKMRPAAFGVFDMMMRRLTEITAEERKKMEESVQSLAPPSWWKTIDELMEKNRQLEKNKKTMEEKDLEMEKMNLQLLEKNREMEEMNLQLLQLEEKNREMEKINLQLEEKNREMEKINLQLEEKNREMEKMNLQLEEKNREMEKKMHLQLEEKNREMEKMNLQLEEKNREITEKNKKTDDLRIVLLGKTGVGKSSTGNTILGRDVFEAEASAKSVTKTCERETAEVNGRQIIVIDTPGLFDTELDNEETQRELTNCISLVLPGPHVFLLLIAINRFTQEERQAVDIIKRTFGESSIKYTIVLFTRGDDLDKSIEEFLGKSRLINIIEQCGKRYHVFDNKKTVEDRTQVSTLLDKIDIMVAANTGGYYTIQQMEMMMKKEELKSEKEDTKEDKDRPKGHGNPTAGPENPTAGPENPTAGTRGSRSSKKKMKSKNKAKGGKS